MNNEQSRIAFIEQRDGIRAAHAFVVQTYKMYRRALMMSRKRKSTNVHFASLPEYRRGFIESCVVFRAYKQRYNIC